MKRSVVLLVFIFVMISFISADSDWHIRSKGGEYGTEDGTSYENAWDGLDKLNWDLISAGDTIHIYGMHPSPDIDVAQHLNTQIVIGKSGTDKKRITIQGHDATILTPRYWLRWNKQHTSWTYHAEGDYYERNGNLYSSPNAIEYDADRGQFNHLFPVNDLSSLSNCQFYYNAGKFYYKPCEGVTNSRVAMGNALNWIIALKTNGQDYITIKDITFVYTMMRIAGSDNIIIDNCTFSKTDYDAIRIGAGSGACNNLEIKNSLFTETKRAAIYLLYKGQRSDNFHIHHNEFINIDPNNTWSSHGDDHGVQLERGNNHLVEYNRFINVGGHTIGIDYGSYGEQKNNTIRYNYCDDSGVSAESMAQYPNEGCVIVEGDNAYIDPERYTGNKIYYNILKNNPNVGIHLGASGNALTGDNILVANNIFIGNNKGLTFSDMWNNGNWVSGMNVYNNIFMDPLKSQLEHTYNSQQETHEHIKLGNNLYYPDAQNYFDWKNKYYNFSKWKESSGKGNGSKVADPLFTDLSNDDFTIQEGSPAIDAGIDVGLEYDFYGHQIVGLPDIGAFEFEGENGQEGGGSSSGSSSSSGGGSGGGSSSGGASVTTALKNRFIEKKQIRTKKFERVKANEELEWEIEDFVITRVKTKSLGDNQDAKIEIRSSNEKLEDTSEIENVYSYIGIDSENISAENITLSLRIDGEWLHENNDKDIVLSKWVETEWEEMRTIEISELSKVDLFSEILGIVVNLINPITGYTVVSYEYLTLEVDGPGYFAISAKVREMPEKIDKIILEESEPETSGNGIMRFFIGAIIILILITSFIIYRILKNKNNQK